MNDLEQKQKERFQKLVLEMQIRSLVRECKGRLKHERKR